MKKVSIIFGAAVTFVWLFIFSISFSIFFPSLAHAGNYHIKGKNLNCYDCHTLHFSQDGKAPDVPVDASPWGAQDYLLKNITSEMCLMCHDGYDLKSPDVMHPQSQSQGRNYQSSAGYFGDEKINSDPTHDEGVRIYGHTLNSTTPPPGYSGPTWNKTLSCTSCHDPHGNTYYRNLRPKPLLDSSNSPVTYFTGTSQVGNEGKGIQILVDPLDESFLRYDVSTIIYRHEGAGGENDVGLSTWCAGCHPAFNQGPQDKGDAAWKLHPTNTIRMSQAKPGILQWWKETASGTPTSPPTVTPADTDRGDDRPFCGSCHKAHGSTHRYGLLWETGGVGDGETGGQKREDGRFLRDTCQACHNMGDGRYEASPHADPNYGVYRLDGFARGECEQCHQQHGTPSPGDPQHPDQGGSTAGSGPRNYYGYNLFTQSNKSLCMNSLGGCHGETPAFYPLSDDTLPQPIKARITGLSVQGQGKAFWGYFEANEAGKRTAGLDYRGRWPGSLAYNDANSPHGHMKSAASCPDCDEGSCMNCHSPHGTESQFDMLKGPYKGTVNSGDKDAQGISISHNYELCFNCHSQNGPWADTVSIESARMKPETRKIADFYNQDDNYSGHRIKSASGFAKPGDKLACSNCHNPHGSMGHSKNGQPNLHLLSDERPGWNGLLDTRTDPASSRRFCLGCHIPSDRPDLVGSSVVEGIEMKKIPDFAEHRESSKESCHDCHGNSYDTAKSENVHHLSPGSCDICHADQGIWEKKLYTGPHKVHTNKYAFACEMCHARVNTKVQKAIHVNGKVPDMNYQYAEVCFHYDSDGSVDSGEWKNQSIHGETYQYRSLYHNPYDESSAVTIDPIYNAKPYDAAGKCDTARGADTCTVTWTDQSSFKGNNSCSTIWCHSNANPISISGSGLSTPRYYRENCYQANPSFHLTWDEHDYTRCNNCHGFLDPNVSVSGSGSGPIEKWQLSSHHRQHIMVTTQGKANTGQAKILCNRCHAKTCTKDVNTIREDIRDDSGYLYHVNGQKDVSFADLSTSTGQAQGPAPTGSQGLPDPSGTYDNNHTCSVSCHSREGMRLPISWTLENPESVCGTCHDVFDGQDPAKTISKDGHYVHLIALQGPHPWQRGGGEKAQRDQWCDECHSSHDDPAHCDGQVTFRDGQTLGSTNVCNTCHSPGGDYDGVNDPFIGAKANWKAAGGSGSPSGSRDSNIYAKNAVDGTVSGELKQGKEKWCVGCHDKDPASSRSDYEEGFRDLGIRDLGNTASDGSLQPKPLSRDAGATDYQNDPNSKAPNIAGNETVPTQYGKGYGYFVTGHGLEGYKAYPASGEKGAGASCTQCHDGTLKHIDHVHRTYAAGKNNYRDGYRLKTSNLAKDPIRPLDIPRTAATGPNNNPQSGWQDFALCFQCHDRTALLGDSVSSGEYLKNPVETNFYDPGKAVATPNFHLLHLRGTGAGNSPFWTSSWNETADSAISCPACHNVHGSPSPRMMRRGELISTPGSDPLDKVPGINFNYLPRPPMNTNLAESQGAEVFGQFNVPGKYGTVPENKFCITCHRASGSYSRTPYINPQNIDPQILSAVAVNNPGGGKGIDDGDRLVITFNMSTNGPDVVKSVSDIESVFEIYADASGQAQGPAPTDKKEWGPGPITSTVRDIEWSASGGYPNDTLTVVLQKDAAVAAGDYLKVPAGNLRGKVGNIELPVNSIRKITGTFDCSMLKANAENMSLSQERGIQEGDQVTIFFSGPTDSSGGQAQGPAPTLTAATIDQALRLNNNHSWGQVKKIEWNAPVRDTLIITFGTGSQAPTVAVGDLITLGNDIILDQSGNPLSGSVVLEGSFDPSPWNTPDAVYCGNISGPPGKDVSKSIDGDLNTLWFLYSNSKAVIIYDLTTYYRISQVRIFSAGTTGTAEVSVWISDTDPDCDPNSLIYNQDSSITGAWEVPLSPITGEWHESSPFDAIGRYVRIEGKKVGTGPLGELFHEVQFKGVTALPHVNHRVLKVEAWNNPLGGTGIDDGDRLTITFNVPTNGPAVVKKPEDLGSVFKVYGSGNISKNWGTPKSIEWLDAGGHSHDTLRVTLQNNATLAAGDRLEVSSISLKGKAEGLELPILSSQLITGSFDCSFIKACAKNQSLGQEQGIQEGDQVILSFAGATSGNALAADAVKEALLLNNGHSWGQVRKTEWNDPDHNTLTITFDSGLPIPTIAVGDLITLGNDIIRDQSANPLSGTVVLEGSFDSIVATWRSPHSVFKASHPGTHMHRPSESIDGDPNTFWFLQGAGQGEITYYMDANYQISQIRIFDGETITAKSQVQAWVTNDGVTNDSDTPTTTWEVINSATGGWFESELFNKKGSYLTIKFAKIGPGALGKYFCEIQFKGIAPPSPP